MPTQPFFPFQPALLPDVVYDGLVYREIAPAIDIAADVACFWTITGGAPLTRPHPYRVVPDGCIDLVFDVGNGAGAWVFGAFDRPVVADLERTVALFGVRIRPGRCGGLIGAPAGVLGERVYDLGDVLGRAGADWYDALRTAGDARSRVAIATMRLADMRRPMGSSDGLAAAIVAVIVARDATRVTALADAFGISTRHLGRLCRTASGLGPKRLARVVRVQRALRALRDGPRREPADVAARFGFADQAHLTHELRTLAGTTPRRAMSDFSKTRPPAAH